MPNASALAKEDTYPVEIKLPFPILSTKLLMPLVETLLKITVMRFAQLGMPVKSIKVPLVDATLVAAVSTLAFITGVPFIVGLAIVGVVSVGLVPKTGLPLPVIVAVPFPPLAIGKMPVIPVVKDKPVALVKTTAEGVPNAGVVNVGLVAKTMLPLPVEVDAPLPPFETGTGAFNTVGATCPDESKKLEKLARFIA